MNLYLDDMGVIGRSARARRACSRVCLRPTAPAWSHTRIAYGALDRDRSCARGPCGPACAAGRPRLPQQPVARHALDQIAEPIAICATRSGPIVSPSCSAPAHRNIAGEDALAAHAHEGRMPRLSLPPAGDRHGRGIRGAVSEADGPALHDFHGVLVVRESVRVRVAVVRRRPLRCRDRGRCRQPLQVDAERLRRARGPGARSLQPVSANRRGIT